MLQAIQLIVGLGNPGDKYAKTRHNAGAWFVEQLAKVRDCVLHPEAKFQAKLAKLPSVTPDCLLLIPTTYMNQSGLSLQKTAQYYKIPPQAILVVHDEIDLPPGSARLKFDGGSGGHNGLNNIIDQLQTKLFHRLRIGVGHPGHREAVTDYVLDPPSKAEHQLIDEALVRAQEVLPFILEGDFQKAMRQLHTE